MAEKYYVVINDAEGVVNDRAYKTVEEAKIAAFDFIKSEEAANVDADYVFLQEIEIDK